MGSTKQFLGLRGNRLKAAMLVLVVAPCFLLFGYNNGSTGSISSLQSFVKVQRGYSVTELLLTRRIAISPD